jgi:hypothetical protein
MKTQNLWSIEQGVSKNLLDLGIKIFGELPLKKKSLTLFDSA